MHSELNSPALNKEAPSINKLTEASEALVKLEESSYYLNKKDHKALIDALHELNRKVDQLVYQQNYTSGKSQGVPLILVLIISILAVSILTIPVIFIVLSHMYS